MKEKTLMTEEDYRKVKMDSSSSIKEFSLDRKKYHRKYVLDEVVKDKFNQAIMMGQLVDLPNGKYANIKYIRLLSHTPL